MNIIIYLNEITSVERRGLVMSLGMAWFLFGFVVQNTLALEVILGTRQSWNYVQLCSILFLLPEILCFRYIPESIGFLYNRGQYQKIQKICHDLYQTDEKDEKSAAEIGLDLDPKQQNISSIDTKHVAWSELWTNSTLKKAVIYIIIYIIFDQGVGVVQISFYSTEIIQSFNFSTLMSQIFSIIFTILRVVASILGSYLTTKISRKLNLQISLFGVIIFNLALFILGCLQRTQLISIFELVCINGMSIFFNLGIHTIILVLPEILPVQYKMMAGRVNAIFSQLLLLIHLLTFPMILKIMNHYVFLLFIVSNLLFAVWIQFRLVESKDVPSGEVFKKFETRW